MYVHHTKDYNISLLELHIRLVHVVNRLLQTILPWHQPQRINTIKSLQHRQKDTQHEQQCACVIKNICPIHNTNKIKLWPITKTTNQPAKLLVYYNTPT